DLVDPEVARLVIGLDAKLIDEVVDPDGGLLAIAGRQVPVGVTVLVGIPHRPGPLPRHLESGRRFLAIGMRGPDADAGDRTWVRSGKGAWGSTPVAWTVLPSQCAREIAEGATRSGTAVNGGLSRRKRNGPICARRNRGSSRATSSSLGWRYGVYCFTSRNARTP